jgi:shikimate kinase
VTATPVSFAGLPVALCGFMGSGKTTVGRRVARALGRSFFDCDEIVAQRLRRSIIDLFTTESEHVFRSEEALVIAELVVERPAGVISLGGGALENPLTRELIFESTAAVYLDRPLRAILASLERLRATRPLLAGRSDEEIAQLYEARTVAFKSCPITVHVDDCDVDGVAERVLEVLGSHGIGRVTGTL